MVEAHTVNLRSTHCVRHCDHHCVCGLVAGRVVQPTESVHVDRRYRTPAKRLISLKRCFARKSGDFVRTPNRFKFGHTGAQAL